MTTGTTATNNYESGNVTNRIAGGTIPAGALVKLHSTEGQVVVTTAITDTPIGVALNSATVGQPVQVQTGGVCKVLIAAAVALNAQVMPDGGGGGKCATAAGATAQSCGLAESQGDTDAQLIRVRFLPSLKGPANS